MSMFASTPQENVEKSFLAFYEGWLARQENLLKQLLSVARNGPLSLPAIYGREIQRGKRRRLPSLFSTLAFRVRKGSPLDWGLQALSNSPFSRRRREGVNGGAEGEGGENEGQDEEGGEGADGGRAALEGLGKALEKVLERADELRALAMRKVVGILSPPRTVALLAATMHFQMRVRMWGLQRAEVGRSRR
ncbi:hypothetical protein JHK82_014781 [Glycine max]|nr:hypothetical protein JHK85_015150 [Glycine max]KAG5045392.1 hypothetical protein JHK86_014798 [Glycine max]KAG5147900.1 hypothetical protein JHK82_014781 [Glycine max]